jgi:hypothetical protein
MVWEAVFFLLVLKIPVVYLGFVVWWAVRGESERGEPEAVAVVCDTPPDGPGHGLTRRPSRRPPLGRPHGRRNRSVTRRANPVAQR